jgi:hypothetical protein
LFFKKATKLISQPAQYIKKTDKGYLKKKKSILGKRNEKKCTKKKTKVKKNTWGKLQCFKEKDKKTKFSTSLIVKK